MSKKITAEQRRNLLKLARFLYTWYLPIVLSAERAAQQSTVLLYHESLQWWARITGDPPLNTIDEYTLALFQEGLRNGGDNE